MIAALGFLVGSLILTGCGKKQSGGPQAGTPEVAVVTVQPERVMLTTELPGRTRCSRADRRAAHPKWL